MNKKISTPETHTYYSYIILHGCILYRNEYYLYIVNLCIWYTRHEYKNVK